MQAKVIKASAGTGKTYRLSMEYLGIMLKHQADPEFSFKNILVITFTKKATAEIRDAVYLRLQEIIINNKTDNIKYLENLTGTSLQENDLRYLQKCYNEMLTNKEFIKISTIDSFINMVFKSMIAPIMNITNYQMQELNNPETYEKVFDALLSNSSDPHIQGFLNRLNIRNKSDISAHFDYLVSYRWLKYFIDHDNKCLFSKLLHFPDSIFEDKQAETKTALLNFYTQVFSLFKDAVTSKDASLLGNVFPLLNTWYINYFKLTDGITFDEFEKRFMNSLSGEFFDRYDNLAQIQKAPNFWSGVKFNRKKYPELYAYLDELTEVLRDSFIFKYLIPELKEIMHFWDVLLKEYDLVKFREKAFTFDDLLWYTYENLYREDNELISPQTSFVTNEFYEYLCMNIQYLLIDEFQDTSVMQFNVFKPIIMELMGGSGKYAETGLIIVGDEKQSIYEWRGGERNLLLQMSDFLGLDKPENLNICFRSKQYLIEIINKLFDKSNYEQLFAGDPENGWEYDNTITSNDKDDSACFLSMTYPYPKISTPFSALSEDSTSDSEEEEGGEETTNDLTPSKINSYKTFVNNLVLQNINPEYYSNTAIIARTNNDLINIEAELLKHNIPCTRESSQPLFEHDLIRALHSLLKFLVYLDWKQLLVFLRSDLVLIPGDLLKEFTKRISLFYKDSLSFEELKAYLSGFDYFKKILALYDKINLNNPEFMSIESILKQIIEEYSVLSIFNQENEIKNLHYYLEIVRDFDLKPAPYTHSLDGFLIYCQDLIDTKSKKQTGLKLNNAIELLTIHKAKGLTYHSVFVYLNNSPRNNTSSNLMYYQFESSKIAELKAWLITSNYASMITKLMPELKAELIRKSNLEEMNNLYVALTRAVQNMAVFIAIPKTQKGEVCNPDRPTAILADQLDTLTSNTDKFVYPEREITQTEQPFSFNGTQYLQTTETFSQNESITDQDKIIQKVNQYLNNKSALYGSLVHDYLSYIRIANPESLEYARKRVLQAYGNLIIKEDISCLLDKVNKFIESHLSYFSENWDRIYNEFTIYNQDKMYRIDRMQVDFTQNKILIIDYKTGEYSDEQIANYQYLIGNLPFVKARNMTIETLYLEVNID